jgi:hypothetical protein
MKDDLISCFFDDVFETANRTTTPYGKYNHVPSTEAFLKCGESLLDFYEKYPVNEDMLLKIYNGEWDNLTPQEKRIYKPFTYENKELTKASKARLAVLLYGQELRESLRKSWDEYKAYRNRFETS